MDNKTLWKAVIPFHSDKIVLTEQITLIDNDEVVPTEQDTTHALNAFFPPI